MKWIISEKEKMRIVRPVKNGTPLLDVCKLEGVSRSALYRWMRLYASKPRWGFKRTD